MGNGALTSAVTLMAADAWLVTASPNKDKYAINFISVALENKIQLEVHKNLMMRIECEIAQKSVSLYIPFTKSRGQIDGSDLGRTLVRIRDEM